MTIEAPPGLGHATSAVGLKLLALMVWRDINPSYLSSLTETTKMRKKAVAYAQKGHKR